MKFIFLGLGLVLLMYWAYCMTLIHGQRPPIIHLHGTKILVSGLSLLGLGVLQ